MSGRTYITTTLPYVNSDPHIGFALELVQADIFARYRKLVGDEIFFNTGTDEHGLKIYQAAEKEGLSVQDYVNDYAGRFKTLPKILGILPEINFIRTTDEYHLKAAQEFWQKCEGVGDIYKKNYKAKYCVGCELEKTDSELVDGRCPIHPNLELEIIEEENYFFRFSNYQQKLLALYEKMPEFVVPGVRFNEIKAFVKNGLEDFSISRLKSKMPWGIEVPNDSDHVMYVWFDALVNYISAVGWPSDEKKFEQWWPVIQFAGKDNLRQQVAMWQAMLMSAGLPPSRQIMIHGFITSGGQKMSKSLGNVINPIELVNEYGTDAVRYFLARHVNPFEDSDFTMERFKEAYNANLANGLGNLVARIMQLSQVNLSVATEKKYQYIFTPDYTEPLNKFEFSRTINYVFENISNLDQKITKTEPFKLIKTNPKEGIELILDLILDLYIIACQLEPFMPQTSATIKEAIKDNKKPDNLFPRKD